MPSFSHKAAHPSASSAPISPTTTSNNAIAVNIIFGVFAVIASIITVWQGHRYWRILRQNHHGDRNEDNNGTVLESALPTDIYTDGDASEATPPGVELATITTTSSAVADDQYVAYNTMSPTIDSLTSRIVNLWQHLSQSRMDIIHSVTLLDQRMERPLSMCNCQTHVAATTAVRL